MTYTHTLLFSFFSDRMYRIRRRNNNYAFSLTKHTQKREGRNERLKNTHDSRLTFGRLEDRSIIYHTRSIL